VSAGRFENALKNARWDAVIFDYGGVLSYAPIRADLSALAVRSGIDEPLFLQVYSNTRDYYGRPPDEYAQHWLRVAGAAGVEVSVDAVEKLIAMESDLWMRPNAVVLELARAVKSAGLKTAILSNMTFDLLGRLRDRFDWLKEFEVQIWSCEEGSAKPDMTIYRSCLAALNCEAARALFFDDRPRNVEAGKRLGIEAYTFESAAQARAILEKCLVSR
jgi:putative hydrolase of the HAD superfamily